GSPTTGGSSCPRSGRSCARWCRSVSGTVVHPCAVTIKMSNDGRNPRQILIEDSRTDPRARIDTDAVPEMHRVEWAERLIRAFPGRPLLDIEHSKPHIRPFDGMASDALRRDGHEITVSADGNWDLHPIDIDCADVPLQRDRFCRA